MKVTLILVGKTTDKNVENIMSMYQNRLIHYASFELIVIPELKQTKSLSEEQQKQKEGELILKNISNSDKLVLLDERGKQFDSIGFSEWIEGEQNASTKKTVFVIGGAYGFSEEVYNRSNFKISLSNMTFSHQIVRAIFLEQLYRAYTIIKGEPYHHR